MSPRLPSPTDPYDSPAELFLGYLDHFRATLAAKVSGLEPEQLGASRLPSGWTPLQLVKHLTFVERRWLVWGFQGRDVGDPWGDQRDGVWHTGPEEDLPRLLDALEQQGRVTTAVVRSTPLTAVGRPGPRWAGAEPATLERVLFHLLQEYARHLGHLDVVRELLDGSTGE